MELTKGMFGSEFNPSKVNFAGLRPGQLRGGANKIGHNSGWYNRAGEKLGFGDLSTDDLKKIQEALEPGQFFVVLSEHDSFWNFVTAYGPIGAMCARDENEQAPGQEYIAEHFRYAVSKDVLYYHGPTGSRIQDLGLKTEVITQEQLLALLRV